ncbi:hypothetical protein [Nocardia brasiliensis]|uniref:hypothetical protein n=1 Tax=Nocardia brasiliensis TaxID=37326 RepID=UPI0024542EF7|nr:hypothetical protein [Nocardia brasiliensis]
MIEIGLAATLKVGDYRLYEDADAFPPFLRPFAEARMRGLETWLELSAPVDWLVLTPPPTLSLDAPSARAYRLGGDALDAELAARPLSYSDLAIAVVDQIASPTHVTVYAAPVDTEPFA